MAPEAAAVLALAALLLFRFWPTLSTPEHRVDEAPYLAAFEAVARGESPYTVHGYLYPPSFAALGGAARAWWSADALLHLLRVTNVVASAALVWLAVSLLRWRWRWRFLASAAYALLSPGVALALRTGNVSPIAGSLIVAGLVLWPSLPLTGGILLGGNLAWKPLGALVAPLLLVHRPLPPGRRHLVAGVAAIVASAIFMLPGVAHLGEFVTFGANLEPEDFRVSRTVSLHRLLLSLGLPVGRLTVAIAVAVAALALVRVRTLTATQFLCFSIAASCLATPALWPHTLLMTLPIQVLALECALRCEAPRNTGATARRARLYELGLVVFGVLALQWSDGIGGLAPEPSLALALALLPPVAAVPLLALYVVKRT